MDKPQRKHPRLKFYDYSKNGYYYITICTHQRLQILSQIVGRGLAPAAQYTDQSQFDDYSPCSIELSSLGQIAENQLNDLPKRYPYIIIDRYVIMPDHIHIIMILQDMPGTAGASPRPTKSSVSDIICAYKSLVTRKCNEIDDTPGRKIFQTSFYEHIIRNEESYLEICKYIYDNPIKRYYDNQEE
ncbi:MAG: hypothetical protein IKO44_00830 [Ruminococcus sp.]|nr:hypothetical protein [Ruminococcus sp.]